MQINLTPFRDWLTCQYPHSSAKKHIISDLALFFSWVGKPPSEISPQDVDRYIYHCLEKTLSPLTINRRLSSLRLIYYFLRIIQEEPLECPVVKRHFLCKPQTLPRDASEEQITALFSVISDKRDKAIFMLMLECGLRVGEVCALCLDDVLFESPPRLKVHGKAGSALPISHLQLYPRSQIGSPAARSQKIGRFSFLSVVNGFPSTVFSSS
jgi:site-specific recombinase XerD